jgi:hypothetical protein
VFCCTDERVYDVAGGQGAASSPRAYHCGGYFENR